MNLKTALKGKCPICNQGDIFKLKGNLLLFRIPKMNSKCEKCNFKFEKETGFFFGAMFVSYALAVAQFIAVFIIAHFMLGLGLLTSFFIIIGTALLFSTINFRFSRIIWIYLFAKYKN